MNQKFHLTNISEFKKQYYYFSVKENTCMECRHCKQEKKEKQITDQQKDINGLKAWSLFASPQNSQKKQKMSLLNNTNMPSIILCHSFQYALLRIHHRISVSNSYYRNQAKVLNIKRVSTNRQGKKKPNGSTRNMDRSY